MKSLPGGVVIWVFAAPELFTFALFFLAFRYAAWSEPGVFAQSQSLVHPGSGAFNTAVLLTASWAAARAVASAGPQLAARWWLASGVLGLVFGAVKVHQYADILSQGIQLSTNLFCFYYLFLTIFHAMHVVAGVVISGVMAFHLFREEDYRGETEEAAAIYWHVIDLVWILLFPLLYLSPPVWSL